MQQELNGPIGLRDPNDKQNQTKTSERVIEGHGHDLRMVSNHSGIHEETNERRKREVPDEAGDASCRNSLLQSYVAAWRLHCVVAMETK
jgi:hypothetical protein